MKLSQLSRAKAGKMLNTGTLLNSLARNSVTYLADVAPSRRCVAALQLAAKFFDRKNFVPGFPDMLCVTKKEFSKKVSSEYRKLEEPIFSLAVYDKLPARGGQRPDLLWIDVEDPKLIRKLEIQYYGVPTMYSGARKSKGLQILIDSKEQKPLWTGPNYQRKFLSVGDYSTEKLLNIFHVERKSPEDLYQTILRGHVRFRNELLKADRSGIKLVMFVESTKKDFVNKNFKGGQDRVANSSTLDKIVTTIEQRYKLEVIWCKTRDACKASILKRLKLEEQKL